MGRLFTKERKRCPSCKSTNFYKRSRRKDHKTKESHVHRNYDLKAYICLKCKHEFDAPVYTSDMTTK